VELLGVNATVVGVDMTDPCELAALCRSGKNRLKVPLLELPAPSPPQKGAEWIEAFQRWRTWQGCQHYEFRAVDKLLTAEQRKRLRQLSTRAAISPTSFVNTYQWGDFKGDPSRLMEQMFDAFLYWANWGTRRFHLRLPDSLVSLRQIEAYCEGPFANVRAHGKDLILEFDAEEIYEDYDDGEEDDWMGSLLPLREDLLRGDYRCLYLAWLRSVQEEEVEDDQYEPPLPAGLRDGSEHMSAFIRFFEIDPDLVAAASEASGAAPQEPSAEAVLKWVRSLSVEEKDELLCAAVQGRRPALPAELLRRYHATNAPATNAALTKLRTVADLRTRATARAEKRERERAARNQAARRRKEAEQAAARAAYLDRLAARVEETWDEVGDLVATKRPNDYDRAVPLLVDLRDLAVRDKRECDFRLGLRTIREEHATKPSFQRRLNEAGLHDDHEPSLPIFER
jgi:hypothetical protein